MDLSNRVTIITGASRGIGAAIAQLLARHGAFIVIADINLIGAGKMEQKITNEGYIAVRTEVDIVSEVSINKMVNFTLEKYGKIDFLVNNAGVNNNTDIDEIKIEEWNKIINIDLRGTHLCSKAIIKEMIKNKFGKIVNIASLAGQIGGLKVGPDYTAAKAGVIGLTKSYARYGAKYGINVNAVSPGFIETDMTKGRDDPKSVPLGRLGTPEDIARAVYFLLSPLSDYITGATIDVNGGLLMR
jgi:3-oxoacyl-[acyl-carrier protein] reductase